MPIRLPHKHGYPGNGYYYVICDVCGKKMRARDSVLITDKYNYLNNMLVCKEDADKTNPQDQIKAVRERQIDNPKYIRTEGGDNFVFISDPSQIEDGDTGSPPIPDPDDPQAGSILLLESGDEILLEDGSSSLLIE